MDTNAAGADRPTAPDQEELRLLADQLTRMRGMLFGYSERFFERIRTYLVLTLALLVIGGANIFPEAVIAVPFLVPFAMLETGYLFYYTVFARRHTEYLERATARLKLVVPAMLLIIYVMLYLTFRRTDEALLVMATRRIMSKPSSIISTGPR